MPHQCLKCGLVFEEGSSQLLKGCPNCGGNRFFFTKNPLDQNERDKITEKIGKDINTTILELMGDQGSLDFPGSYLTLVIMWIVIIYNEFSNLINQFLSVLIVIYTCIYWISNYHFKMP